jgi:hypothetical protein
MKTYRKIAAFACLLVVAAAAVSRAVTADLPQDPRLVALRKPNGAYRTAEVDPAFLVPGSPASLVPSPIPGRISFTVKGETWTGRDKPAAQLEQTGWHSARYRVEVYDPRQDPEVDPPLFIKNGPVRRVRANPNEDFLEFWRDEVNLGPFPRSDDPYVVKVMMLHGKVDPEKKATVDDVTQSTTLHVNVN